MQSFRLLQGTGLIENSKFLGISGFSGSIGSTARYSEEILTIESRLEDPLENIIEEFKDKSITQYIHLAAITDTNWCMNFPKECFLFNSEYSQKFYKAASVAQVDRFVFVSTSHVYDNSNKVPFDLNTPLNPASIYGKSKLNAEIKLLEQQNEDTKLSIARVFSVTGKNTRDHFLYQGLHRRAQNKDFSLIPGLENTRDFLDASTVMSELIRLARSVDFPALVNICSGKGKTIREIAKDVFSLYGFEKQIEKMHSPQEDSPTKIIGVPTIFK